MATEPKNPRVPVLPVNAEATAQQLLRIIDAGSEQSPLAYAALTRLCVMWVPNALNAAQSMIVVNDLIGLMFQLFPGGEGLPPTEGCPL
jgi:hypothetical protein